MSENIPVPPSPGIDPSVTACANCHSSMPAGLRFCRNCGYRLGEGVAEYTETVRFQNGQPGPNTAPAGPPNYATSYGLGGGPIGASAARQMNRKRPIRMTGMTWMVVGLVAIFGVAGGATQLARRAVSKAGIARGFMASRSFLGVKTLNTVDGGVTFQNVTPGSDADRAGLVGGDIITTFDSQEIISEHQMRGILQKTPIGKTVDVVFIRDRETKTTKITTISEADSDRLEHSFSHRPEGLGRFGYDTSDIKRVEVPGTALHGVLLEKVTPNQSADVAGVQAGDIVIEFDDGTVRVPIRTTDEFVSRTRRARPFTTIKVVVMRGDQRLEIPVNMGRQP